MKSTFASIALLALAMVGAQAADQHGGGNHDAPGNVADRAAGQQKPWGRPGDTKAVTRTIEISMSDAMRFSPAQLQIRQGETIRFRVKNAGKLEHEMIIGTAAELDAHAARMLKNAPATHGHEETGVEVKPGRTGDLVWNFNRAGDFQFACLVPGHFQAGMVGTLKVTKQ